MRRSPGLLFAALGAFALVSQSLLLREFHLYYATTELAVGIFFAAWFLWVALGAWIGRAATKLFTAFGLFLPAYALSPLLANHLLKTMWAWEGVAAYDITPPLYLAGILAIYTAPLSLLTGLLFCWGCRWWEDQAPCDTHIPIASQIYRWEVLGAFLGGCGVTGALSIGLSFSVLCLSTCLLLLFLIALLHKWLLPGRRVALLPLAFLLLATAYQGMRIQETQVWNRWAPEGAPLGSFHTPQGDYVYGERKGHFLALTGRGVGEVLPLSSESDAWAAGCLAQQPRAKRILCLGSGLAPTACALAQIPQIEEVAWLHPDPAFPSAFFAAASAQYPKPDSLKTPQEDIRAFLRKPNQAYDLLILYAPYALSLAENRLLTREALSDAVTQVSESGVLAIATPGGANYLSEEARYLGGEVWRNIAALELGGSMAVQAGEISWIYASRSADLLEDPHALARRFAVIPGSERIYPAAAVTDLFPAERAVALRQAYEEVRTQERGEIFENRDAKPLALLLGLLLELKRLGLPFNLDTIRRLQQSIAPLFLGAIGLFTLLALAYGPRSRPASPRPLDALYLVFSVGSAVMALSICLMLSYQTRFSALYLHLGLLSACFMGGAFLGAWATARLLAKNSSGRRIGIFLFVALLICVLLGLLLITQAVFSMAAYWLLFALSGLLSGACFPCAAHWLRLAGKTEVQSAARLESIDHLGAALGAGLTGVFLVPLYGAAVALTLVALLLTSTLPGLIFGARSKKENYPASGFRAMSYLLFGLIAWLLLASSLYESLKTPDAPQWEERLGQYLKTWNEDDHPTTVVQGKEQVYGLIEGEEARYLFEAGPGLPPVQGYGGPLQLAIAMTEGGQLRHLAISGGQESPAYVEMLSTWLDSLAGESLLQRKLEVDAVSGATLTSEAILTLMPRAARHFAQVELGKTVLESTPPDKRATETAAWVLPAFFLTALLLRHYPRPWLRRGFLLLSLLVLGLGLNLQYTLSNVYRLLSFPWPAPAFSSPFLLIILTPISILLVGNLYCGWLCPFGALQELVGDLRPKRWQTAPSKRVWRWGRGVKYLVLAWLLLLFALTRNTESFSIDPMLRFFSGAPETGLFAFGVLLIALAFFYPRFWCRSLCPAGAFLALLSRLRLLRSLSPTVLPKRCDMGVESHRELDCLACDRCRHE